MNSAAILGWALQTGLAVSILIGLVLIARRPFARYFGPHAAYALWSLPVIRFFMPDINIPIFERKIPEIVPNIETLFLSQATPTLPTPVDPDTAINWPPLIVGLWLGMAAIWLIFQVLKQSNYMNALQDRTASADSLMPKVNKASRLAGLRRGPNVRLAPDNSGPMVTGVLHPLIVLPKDFESHYSASQQDFALLHECTHIRRKDLWAALGALVFRAINWPNPLIHYAAHKFRADQEAACDAAVLRLMGGSSDTAHGYAETLVHAAKHSNSDGAIQPLGLTIHHPLKERLMTLKTSTLKPSVFSRTAAASTIILTLAASAPLTLAGSHPGETTVEVDARAKAKKVIKWSQKDDNGNETSKHYEIITENGDTTAWEIDTFGNKTEVDPDDIETHGNVKVIGFGSGELMTLGDGEMYFGEDSESVVLKNILNGEKGNFPQGFDTEKLIVKRLEGGKKGNVFAFSSDHDFEFKAHENGFVFGGKGHTQSLLTAAEAMLSNAKTDDLSSSARRKLEKAQKALEDARKAIEAESE